MSCSSVRRGLTRPRQWVHVGIKTVVAHRVTPRRLHPLGQPSQPTVGQHRDRPWALADDPSHLGHLQPPRTRRATTSAWSAGGSATMTIEEYSSRLRDEVDLEALSAFLLTVVDQMMEPAHTSLWLRPPRSGGQPHHEDGGRRRGVASPGGGCEGPEAAGRRCEGWSEVRVQGSHSAAWCPQATLTG
jgi:hypothetical protein